MNHIKFRILFSDDQETKEVCEEWVKYMFMFLGKGEKSSRAVVFLLVS